ncbi:rhodanese-related sulfurtransferase [Paenibacillus cellulosilyticus]|uniref:Rhodanese-related sulfurtransferase n=1 Tax=Paenibacillus cellulosilyticus TaxID=375489 RepID=A0A2V2YYR7_9BACL|nr:rhodanese-like domain-containing protein [Paenibacillus cellulosilyticus]PWW05584.1 rhodanese-related sulfurtransferase [Paenibacillus cellulosilyticus]QKS45383.1 rhodanese-like domain-containing protein [Paenibacillus cellulosilyticus]
MNQWENIDAHALLKLLADGSLKPDQIIDVREHHEWDYYRLDGTTHIPMSIFPDQLASLAKSEPWYILCAHGVRSVAVCRYMQENGYDTLHNIVGGIAAVAELKGFQYD